MAAGARRCRPAILPWLVTIRHPRPACALLPAQAVELTADGLTGNGDLSRSCTAPDIKPGIMYGASNIAGACC